MVTTVDPTVPLAHYIEAEEQALRVLTVTPTAQARVAYDLAVQRVDLRTRVTVTL